MPAPWQGILKKIDNWRWEIPQSYKAGMKVPVALGKSQSQAQKYLSGIVKQLSYKGLSVRWEVLLGQPAEAITAFTEQTGADLIALASHGRSGPSRWAFGSVAEKVFRASRIPVLMIKALQQ